MRACRLSSGAGAEEAIGTAARLGFRCRLRQPQAVLAATAEAEMVGADPGGMAVPDAQLPAPRRRRLLGRRVVPGAGEAMDALTTGIGIATALRDGLTAPAASGAARRLRALL